MKIEFRFNDVSQIVLSPENQKEVTLLRLAFLDDKNKPNMDFQASENAIITITLCANP